MIHFRAPAIWVLILAAPAAAQRGGSADSAHIAALEQRIEEAVVRRDTLFLDSVYAPTFRFKHATGQLEDRARRMQGLRAVPRPGAGMVERRVDSLDVEVHGDVALTTGRIHIKRDGPPTPTRDYTIRYARVYVRRDGRWRLLTHHSTEQVHDLPAVAATGPVKHLRSTGSLIQTDSVVAQKQPGPHRGTGETTGYSFFGNVRDLEWIFRKRALHPGASIGYHYHGDDHDEIYYVLSGRGELLLDSTRYMVGPGAAILTRPGSSHGIRQVGGEDLVLLISYINEGARTRIARDTSRATPRSSP